MNWITTPIMSLLKNLIDTKLRNTKLKRSCVNSKINSIINVS